MWLCVVHADEWVAQDGGAEGARITQSPKGESRFHPIGNEEPLKDFKSSQVLPGWCVRKQAPGWLPPGPLCLAKVRQSPASQRMAFPAAYTSPQSAGNVMLASAPRVLNSN